MSFSFDWRGFAKLFANQLGGVPIPLKKDGDQPWSGWEKLRGKAITDKDLDRWINNKDFGGFALLFGESTAPVVISPTLNELYEINPIIFAFVKMSPEDLHIDWKLASAEMNKAYAKNRSKK